MGIRDFFQGLLKKTAKVNPQDLIKKVEEIGVVRAPRVKIDPLHQVFFQVAGDPFPVSVVNLSVSGLALSRNGREEWPEAESTLGGALQIGAQKYPLHLKLVHATHGIVGFSFLTPSREVTTAIESHLQAELEALRMIYIEPENLEPQPDGTPHWYQGRNNSNLFYVERESKIQRFHLMFFANYLEGGHSRPIRFGLVTQEKNLAKDRNEAIRWFKMLDAEQLSTTIRFIRSIPSLDPAHKEGILKLIY